MFRKKFNVKAEHFPFITTSLNESTGDGALGTITNFYDPSGTRLSSDTLNQHSNTDGSLRGYTTRAVYTEPLLKRSLLEFSVSKANTQNNQNCLRMIIISCQENMIT